MGYQRDNTLDEQGSSAALNSDVAKLVFVKLHRTAFALNSCGAGLALIKCSKLLVAMRPGDTPVPIPNTMVKTWAADGTALETVWESRWLPEF